MPRAALTAKQRACPHPYRETAPCVDDRYERCQLCGLIRLAPLPAPWIVAHDEAQPVPEAPALFDLPRLMEPVSVPVVEVPAVVRGPVEVLTPGPRRAQTIRERDDALLGFNRDRWEAPQLDEADARECARCGGKGSRREAVRVDDSGRLVYARRRCSRCGGTGRTCRYSA